MLRVYESSSCCAFSPAFTIICLVFAYYFWFEVFLFLHSFKNQSIFGDKYCHFYRSLITAYCTSCIVSNASTLSFLGVHVWGPFSPELTWNKCPVKLRHETDSESQMASTAFAAVSGKFFPTDTSSSLLSPTF